MTDNFQFLKNAIETKQVVAATYKGYYRELCVTTLGYRQGVARFLAYQCGGLSSSGPVSTGSPNNWRCMDVDLLENPEFIPGEWVAESDHAKSQKCIERVVAEVAF